jgi:hypothetical protein
MGGVIADLGGNPRSSVSCFMNASKLRASACYREDSRDHAEQPLENESRNGVVLSSERHRVMCRGVRWAVLVRVAVDGEAPSCV